MTGERSNSNCSGKRNRSARRRGSWPRARPDGTMGIGDGFLSGFEIRLTGRCWCRHGSTDLIIWGVLMIWFVATSGEGFVASPSLSRTQQPLRSRRGFARGFSDLRTFRFGVGEIATGLRSNLKNVGHRRMQIMLIGACGCTVVHVVRLFVILDLVLPGWDGMGGRMLQGSAPSSIRSLSAAGGCACFGV